MPVSALEARSHCPFARTVLGFCDRLVRGLTEGDPLRAFDVAGESIAPAPGRQTSYDSAGTGEVAGNIVVPIGNDAAGHGHRPGNFAWAVPAEGHPGSVETS